MRSFVYWAIPCQFSGSGQGRGATSSSLRGSNSHETSFDDVIMFTQPWYNFFANCHR